jgi:hydrogenase-4 component B
MNPALALVGAFLAGMGGLVAALVSIRRPRLSAAIGIGTMLLGAACGIIAAVRVSLGNSEVRWSHAWAVPGGAFDIRLDPIAAIFLAQVFLLGALGSVYGIGYWPIEKHPATSGRLRAFYGLLVAGMALVVMANNAILFLFAWEVMALAAFLALTVEDRNAETRQCGFVYLVATRVGTLALIAMFALLRAATSSFSLSSARIAADSSLGTSIFCLGLLGFGLKAGLMPLHIWLPGAHANAPTHVSALMSGVMIKMGVYGLIRIGSFYDRIPLWWGMTLFGLGAISAVLGVAFALGQHDLKRLLAYHSVENIGIIVMSLGVAMIGRSTARVELVALGLAGALLHTFNHGLFKALLFFCAGSVISGTGTRELDRMGGLAKRMPWTALAFLVGAAAICGLPPLNGFVSELFLYIGMLKGGALGSGSIGSLLTFGVPTLALVGALAVACFVKVHGVVFLGEPRCESDLDARESPLSMLLPMAALGAGCVIIGSLPLLVTGVLERAISTWDAGSTPIRLSALVPLVPLMWANLVLLVTVASLACLAKLRTARTQIVHGPTWDCGYASPSPRMQYTASSFAESLVALFSMVLRPRMTAPVIDQPFPSKSRFESHVPEVVLDLAVLPTLRWFGRTIDWFRWLQPGSIHLYIVYILVALVVMLFVWH